MEDFKEFFYASLPQQELSDAEVLNLYLHSRDMKVLEIADKSNRSVPEVYRIIKRFSMEPNRLVNRHQSVRYYADAGMGISEISELTGYTSRNVRYILSKKNLNEGE